MADDKQGNDGTVAEVVDAPGTAEERRTQVVREYGQWVALEPIDHGGARAYNVGDPVPAGNVSRWGYDKTGRVAKAGTKEALAAQGRR